MKKKVGVWIDHRGAVIVTAGGGGKEINRIQSNLEKHVRRPSEHACSTDDGPEEQRQSFVVWPLFSAGAGIGFNPRTYCPCATRINRQEAAL